MKARRGGECRLSPERRRKGSRLCRRDAAEESAESTLDPRSWTSRLALLRSRRRDRRRRRRRQHRAEELIGRVAVHQQFAAGELGMQDELLALELEDAGGLQRGKLLLNELLGELLHLRLVGIGTLLGQDLHGVR